MISRLMSFSCTFLKSGLSETLSKLDLIIIMLVWFFLCNVKKKRWTKIELWRIPELMALSEDDLYFAATYSLLLQGNDSIRRNKFGKLRTMRGICASVVYVPSVPTSHFYVDTCQRAKECTNMPKVRKVFNLVWQRTKGASVIKSGVLKCQKEHKKALQFFNFYCQMMY